MTHQVSQTQYSPGGVQSKPRSNIDTQGLLQSTSSSTDIAISGTGLFVVNSKSNNAEGEFAYTRAGSFKVDQNGYLENVSGWYLQGWPLANWDGTASADYQTINGSQYMAAYKGTNGQYTYISPDNVDATDLQPLNLNNIAGTAQATTSISMGANLPSSATIGTTEQQPLQEYDSLGNSHNVETTWTLTAQNSWSLAVTPPEGSRTVSLYDDGTSTATPQVYATSGRLDFTAAPTTGVISMDIGGLGATYGGATSNAWNFVVGAGTNGTPANTLYSVGSPSVTSAPQFASTLASDINQAYLTTYSGSQQTVTASGTDVNGNAVLTPPTSQTTTPTLTGFQNGTVISVTDSGTGTAVPVDISGLSLTAAAALIQSTVRASSPVTLAAFTATAGGGGIAFADGVNTIGVTGSDAFPTVAAAANSSTGAITMDGFVTGSAVTVTGPNGTESAVDLSGLTMAAAATKLNGFNGTTGVDVTASATHIIFTPTSAGGFSVTAGAGDGLTLDFATVTSTGAAITVTGPTSSAGGTTVNLTNMTISQAAAAIDAKYDVTGVHAYVNGGKIAFYTDKSGPVSISGGTGDAATLDCSFTGTGVTYASQVAGTGGVTFSNFDQTNAVSVSGLTSVLNSTPFSTTPTLAAFSDTSTVTINDGGTSYGPIALKGDSITTAINAINTFVSAAGGPAAIASAGGPTNTITFTHAGKTISASGTGAFPDMPASTSPTTSPQISLNAFAVGSLITVDGPAGTQTITLDGMTLTEAASAITAQYASTGVAAAVSKSGTSLVFTSQSGTVKLYGTGGVANLGTSLTTATTYNTSGTELCEQTNVASSPDGFTLSKVAGTVYSGSVGTAVTNGTPNTPAIVFNGNGTPSAINVGSMAITWANGSQDQTTASSLTASPPIALNFGSLDTSNGMTQLSGSYQLTFQNQNGAQFGNLSSLTVGADGVVTANFDNGVTRPIFQIPVATFVDPDGLGSKTGDIFTASDASGLPTLRVPGTAGSGSTNQSSLEASTVDIGTQFTEMIVTQRAYSASAKIITTANQMLDDLLSIVR